MDSTTTHAEGGQIVQDRLPLWAGLTYALSECRAVDQVELRVQLADSGLGVDEAAGLLGMRARNQRSREVYYLDSPDLMLHRRSLIVRARSNDDGTADVAVKLRLPRAHRVSRPVRRMKRLVVELDALPGRTLWCVSLKRPLDRSALPATLGDKRPWGKLCSTDQRLFLRALGAA